MKRSGAMLGRTSKNLLKVCKLPSNWVALPPRPTKIRLDRACLPNSQAPTPSVNSTQRDGTSPNSIDDTIDRITRGDDTRVGQSSTRKIPRRNQIRMDETGKELGDVQQAVLPVDSERYQTGIVPQKMEIQDFEEQIEFMLSKLEEAKSTTCPGGKLFSVVLRELNFIFLGQVGLDLVEKTSEKIKEMIRKAEEEQSKIPEIVIKERSESLLCLCAAHGHVDVPRL
ncbi:unnamed protein product [Caenorhabditis nigoni]